MIWRKKVAILAAWSMVQLPKNKGGLGVINLRIHNGSLLLKQLHKFNTKQDIPWVNLIWQTYYQQKVPHAAREVGSFWWKDILRLHTLYRGIARCILGCGSSVLFWEDLQCPIVLAQAFRNLFTSAANANASVKDIINAPDLVTIFNLPLSEQVDEEFLEMQNLISQVHYNDNLDDGWVFRWGNDSYSSQKVYKLAFEGL